MRAKKKSGLRYLYLIIGGLFAVSLLALVAFSFAPLEGCVGVVRIDGPLVTQDVEATLFADEIKGSQTISAEIESAAKRTEVKSILVLIDSPGGSVVASREVYDALHKLGKKKVAYINELGTSGAYYVAAGTDYIVANPDAITGSIGARATFADLSGLFEKIGYNETSIKTGAMKDIGTPARSMSEEEKAVIASIINESFQEFRSAVLESRGSRLDRKAFEKVLDARILTGRQAKKIGLVDELGNRKAAIKKAAELGGIKAEEPSLCDLSSSKGRRSLLGFSSQLLDFVAAKAGIPKISYS
ncbi:MAG: signal peptide peptidase SppA [Candidatus Micrarchaeota archaeon]|nr:signal peptide peptidase SppA [Candidatus Micrarchaeota archaeon]